MSAKKPGLEDLTVDEREVMLETMARICVGMFTDLVRLKHPAADPALRKRRVRRVRHIEEGPA